jgi:hypothetical protein
MSHPAASILDIASPTRDQVNMAVEDPAAGGFAGVDAYVSACREDPDRIGRPRTG